MDYRLRGLLAALGAAGALALCVGAASATSIAFSSTGIRFTFPEFEVRGPSATVSCPVTMEGSFHARTISKTANGLIGLITRAAVGTEACTGGRITALATPWHIQYSSFQGTLPAIRSIEMKLVEAGFLIEILALSCLYKTTPSTPGRIVAEVVSEVIGPVEWTEANIPLWVGSGLCPGEVRFGSGGRATVLGGREAVGVRLVFG